MRPPDPKGRFRALYLSVPGTMTEDAGNEWAESLRVERDLRGRSGAVPAARPESILIGGAAPDRLGGRLCERVRRVLPEASSHPAEWTVEVSTADVDRSTLAAWRAGGVTRICIRADPDTGPAGWNHRRLACIRTADLVGFPVVAADLLVGSASDPSPKESSATWLDRIASAGADHISVYERPEGSDDSRAAVGRATAGSWLAVLRRMRTLGYAADDMLNHSRPGASSLYARALRGRHPVLGFGPGARSFRNPCRRWNVPEWQGYLRSLQKGRDPVESGERLDRDEVRLERIWLRLQDGRGMRLPSGVPGLEQQLDRWTAEGWVDRLDSRLRLTPEGWLRLDGIAVELAAILSVPRRRGEIP